MHLEFELFIQFKSQQLEAAFFKDVFPCHATRQTHMSIFLRIFKKTYPFKTTANISI